MKGKQNGNPCFKRYYIAVLKKNISRNGITIAGYNDTFFSLVK